jgi:hypothetical protein
MKKYFFLFMVGCLTFLSAQAESIRVDKAPSFDYVKSQVESHYLADLWTSAQSNHAFVDAFADALESFSNAETEVDSASVSGVVYKALND